MSHGTLITALLTANVFQNGLSRHEASWRYYTDLLRRLSCKPVDWYISALDFDLAFILQDIYNLGGDWLCQEACVEMRKQVKVCPVNEWILEDSGSYRLNFYDAIRLACAVDSCVDAIVTWEPQQFALTDKQRHQSEHEGYFYIDFATQIVDEDKSGTYCIGVFSVPAFLLHLDQREHAERQRHQPMQSFYLDKLQVDIDDDDDVQATVRINSASGQQIQSMASGSTPCDALYRAIDQCIDQYVLLPRRNLIHFTIPSTIGGPETRVEVMISVECDRRIFEASAANANVIRALGEAYIDAINNICSNLNFAGYSRHIED